MKKNTETKLVARRFDLTRTAKKDEDVWHPSIPKVCEENEKLSVLLKSDDGFSTAFDDSLLFKISGIKYNIHSNF